MLIGVDYHPSFQQIAFLVEETGDCSERRLNHSDGEAERFYREEESACAWGMEATLWNRRCARRMVMCAVTRADPLRLPFATSRRECAQGRTTGEGVGKLSARSSGRRSRCWCG